jgi:hypothetical protein
MIMIFVVPLFSARTRILKRERFVVPEAPVKSTALHQMLDAGTVLFFGMEAHEVLKETPVIRATEGFCTVIVILNPESPAVALSRITS